MFSGELAAVVPDVTDPQFIELLSWADRFRRLGVWANADYARDAERARRFGAEGLGLCRTEHMYFEAERVPVVQSMILARSPRRTRGASGQTAADAARGFRGSLRAMDGLPVTIRLIDPPLHEFLPSHDELQKSITEIEMRLKLKRRQRLRGWRRS